MARAGQKRPRTDLRIDPQAELVAERLGGGGAGSGGPQKGGERRGR